MRLKPFLLDEWLDAHEHHAEFNLASSTGPVWTLNEFLSLATEEERERFHHQKMVYSRPAGADALRSAIAQMHGVEAEAVQVVTGASEALLILFWLAAEPGANVILPQPGFTTFSALPESLHLETRYYTLRKENSFRIDIEEIQKLADHNTKLILINSPHNPTGATISDAELDALHEFTSSRGIQLVSDEVYHPIFHGEPTQSASRLPGATVIHDFSKAFPLSGIRTGWIIDHDPKRRRDYWTTRAYFSITNNAPGEFLAELAIRHREQVLGRTQKVATENLHLLTSFMSQHSDTLGWISPRGGMTTFPWLVSGEDSREFCKAAAEQGIILAPGDCFNAPSHFRLGFAALPPEKFTEALSQLSELVKTWASVNLLKA
ncbi:aminotransferase class I/II-fold pyridoxal phosphate-dependent enzyme [Terracidiphilus gabretensis]|uniref:aminotransferase class I/II-fold pyridoxal phosphate-dependent enzyme n=1 Tax=Terracidiphilus gabretensis TaxID=1577687 RepID=UPI00071B2A7C|nr:aminotransferase class I/II-fold pyridoxal phosphate-dependent enzyme [Terracidiphilus gabretensis]